MYFISCFEKLEKNELGWVDTGGIRCMGYIGTKEYATELLHNNDCDIRECLYDYAIIEKYNGAGLYPITTYRQFFKWDNDKQGFYEIEEPEIAINTCNFAIG